MTASTTCTRLPVFRGSIVLERCLPESRSVRGPLYGLFQMMQGPHLFFACGFVRGCLCTYSFARQNCHQGGRRIFSGRGADTRTFTLELLPTKLDDN